MMGALNKIGGNGMDSRANLWLMQLTACHAAHVCRVHTGPGGCCCGPS